MNSRRAGVNRADPAMRQISDFDQPTPETRHRSKQSIKSSKSTLSKSSKKMMGHQRRMLREKWGYKDEEENTGIDESKRLPYHLRKHMAENGNNASLFGEINEKGNA